MATWWNMLTLEQLRALTDEQITRHVNDRLAPQLAAGNVWVLQPVDFIAAQFYMSELDRREHTRADVERVRIETTRRRVDLGLELLIVVLIGLEIGLALWGYRQQSTDAARELKAFGDMQLVLSHLQDTSKATADTMVALQTTTETMATSLQKQLALSYEVAVTPIWDASTKKISIVNNGRTNVAVWGYKLANEPAIIWNSRVISPQGTYILVASQIYDDMKVKVPKGTGGYVLFELYIKNDKGEEFVQHCVIGLTWKEDDLILGMQVVSVEPEHWSKDVKKAEAK